MDNGEQLREDAKKAAVEKVLSVDEKLKQLAKLSEIMDKLVMHDVVYTNPETKEETQLKDKTDVVKKMDEFKGEPFYESTRPGNYHFMIIDFCVSKGISQEDILRLVNDEDNPQNEETMNKIQDLRQEYFELITGKDYEKIATFYASYIDKTFDRALDLVKDTDSIDKLHENIDKIYIMNGAQSVFVQTLKYNSEGENRPIVRQLISKINEKMAARGESYENMHNVYSLLNGCCQFVRDVQKSSGDLSVSAMNTVVLANDLSMMSRTVKNINRGDFADVNGNISRFLEQGWLYTPMDLYSVAHSEKKIRAIDDMINAINNPSVQFPDISGDVCIIDDTLSGVNDYSKIADAKEYERIMNMSDDEFVKEMDALDKAGKPYNTMVCTRYMRSIEGKNVDENDPRHKKVQVCERINAQKMFLALPTMVVMDKLAEQSITYGINLFADSVYKDAMVYYKGTPFAGILEKISDFKDCSIDDLKTAAKQVNLQDIERIVGEKIEAGAIDAEGERKYVLTKNYMNLCKLSEGKVIPVFERGKAYSKAEIQTLLNGAYDNNGKLFYYEEKDKYPYELRKRTLSIVKNSNATEKEDFVISRTVLENRVKAKVTDNAFEKVRNQGAVETLEYFTQCAEKKWVLSEAEIDYLMNSDNSPFTDKEKAEINEFVKNPKQMERLPELGKLVVGSLFYNENSAYLDNAFIEPLAEKYDITAAQMKELLSAEPIYKPVLANEAKIKYLEDRAKNRETASEEMKEFVKNADEMKAVFTDFRKAEKIMVEIMCDGGYFNTPTGERMEYHSLEEFDRIHKEYFYGKPFDEVTRNGVEPIMMRFFLESKGIDSNTFLTLARDPKSEAAAKLRDEIAGYRQEYARLVSENNTEEISQFYARAIANYSAKAPEILNSFGSLKDIKDHYADIMFFSGAQSAILQTLNLGKGGNPGVDKILDRTTEILAERGLNFGNISDTLYCINYFSNTWNMMGSTRSHVKYDNVEDLHNSVNSLAYISKFISGRFGGADIDLINKMPDTYTDIMTFMQTVNGEPELESEPSDRFAGRLKSFVLGGADYADSYMFIPANFTKFAVDTDLAEYEYICQKNDPDSDDEVTVAKSLRNERVYGFQTYRNVNAMTDSEFKENIEEGSDAFRLFNPVEVARYKSDDKVDLTKPFDEMTISMQNMAASEFLLKNMMYITGSEEVADSFYNSLTDANDKKMFVRAINLGIEEPVLGETFGKLCGGRFKDLCIEDMRSCIGKEIESNGGSELFRNLHSNVTVDSVSHYLNERYGALSRSGRFRLNLAERYANVISGADKMPLYVAELGYVSEGSKSPEYQRFYDAASAYVNSEGTAAQKYELLEKLNKAASDYMTSKGNPERRTDKGQRRYDLAKNMQKYAEIEQNKIDLSEIKRYDEAKRTGQDLSNMGFSERTVKLYKLSRVFLIGLQESAADLYSAKVNPLSYEKGCKKAIIAYNSFLLTKNAHYIDAAIEEALSAFVRYDKKDMRTQSFIKDYDRVEDKQGFIKYYNELRQDVIDASADKNKFIGLDARRHHTCFMAKYRFDTEPEKATASFVNYFKGFAGVDISDKEQLKKIYTIKGEDKVPLFADGEELSEAQIYERVMLTSFDSRVYVDSVGLAYPQIYGFNPERNIIGFVHNPEKNPVARKAAEELAGELAAQRISEDEKRLMKLHDVIILKDIAYANADNLLKPNIVIDENIPFKDAVNVNYVNDSELSEEDCIVIALGAVTSLEANKGKKLTSSSSYIKSNDPVEILKSQRTMIMDNIFSTKEYVRHEGGFAAIGDGRNMTGHAIEEYKKGNIDEVVKYLNIAIETLNAEASQVSIYDGPRAIMMSKMMQRLENIAAKPQFKDKTDFSEGVKNQFRFFRTRVGLATALSEPAGRISANIDAKKEYSKDDIAEFIGLQQLVIDCSQAIQTEELEAKKQISDEIQSRKEQFPNEIERAFRVDELYLQRRIEGTLILPTEQKVLDGFDDMKREYVEKAKKSPLFELCSSMEPNDFREYIIESVTSYKNNHTPLAKEYLAVHELSFEGKKAYLEYLDANNAVVPPYCINEFKRTMIPYLPEEVQKAYEGAVTQMDATLYGKLPSYIQNVLRSECYSKNSDYYAIRSDAEYDKSVLAKLGNEAKNPAIEDLFKTKYVKLEDRKRDSILKKLGGEYKPTLKDAGLDLGSPQSMEDFVDSPTSLRGKVETLADAYFVCNMSETTDEKVINMLEKKINDFFMPSKLDKDGNRVLDEKSMELRIDALVEYQRSLKLQQGREILAYRKQLQEQYGDNLDAKGRDVNFEIAKKYALFGPGKYRNDCVADLIRGWTMGIDETLLKDAPSFEERVLNEIAAKTKAYKDTLQGDDKEAYEAALDDGLHLDDDAKGYEKGKVTEIQTASRDSYLADIRKKWPDMPDVETFLKRKDEAFAIQQSQKAEKEAYEKAKAAQDKAYSNLSKSETVSKEELLSIPNPNTEELNNMSADGFEELIDKYMPADIKDKAHGDEIFDYLKIKGVPLNELYPDASSEEKKKLFMNALSVFKKVKTSGTDIDGKNYNKVYSEEDLNKNEKIRSYMSGYDAAVTNAEIDKAKEGAQKAEEPVRVSGDEKAPEDRKAEEPEKAPEDKDKAQEPEKAPADEEKAQEPEKASEDEQVEAPVRERVDLSNLMEEERKVEPKKTHKALTKSAPEVEKDDDKDQDKGKDDKGIVH